VEPQRGLDRDEDEEQHERREEHHLEAHVAPIERGRPAAPTPDR
jgi:hypothetical protein